METEVRNIMKHNLKIMLRRVIRLCIVRNVKRGLVGGLRCTRLIAAIDAITVVIIDLRGLEKVRPAATREFP